MNPVLRIENYTKEYTKGTKAVDNLSLDAEPGDIYGFVGQNGAGKSTTIKGVVGIMDFDGGEVFIDGHNVRTEPMECKQITAFIPDNPDIYENLTGIQYLNFIADIFGISETDRKERIDRYAKLFEITDDLGDLVSSYSHGMRQKVVLIGAFIHEPKLLVLDEPFVGLDPKASRTVRDLMHEVCDNGGAVFFSTHVLDVAQKLCNKIAIIKHGKLIASGKMEDLIGDQSLEDVFLEVTDNEE